MTRTQTFRIAVRKFPAFEQAIHAQWQAFEAQAKTGLQLDLVPLDLQDLEHSLFTAGGMKNGTWDAAFIATDWIAAMQAQGCAIDLAPLITQDPPEDYPQGWTDSLLRLQRIDEAILGVPYHDGPECLIYRRDLFEAQGLTPPTTWQQFHQTARLLNNPAQNLYGAVFAAFPDGHNTVYDFLLQLWTRGGTLFPTPTAPPNFPTPTAPPNFQTPEAEQALTFYRQILTDPAAIHPASPSLDSVAAGLRFAAGEAAMMINWFGFATMAHTSPDSLVRGLVDIAPIPSAPGHPTASLNVYWILSIPTGTPDPDIAWRFLRHTQISAMDLLTTTSGAIGCRKSTWANPAIQSQIPFYPHLETLHRHAREIPQRPDWPQIAATIDTLVTATITTQTPIRTLLNEASLAFTNH